MKAICKTNNTKRLVKGAIYDVHRLENLSTSTKKITPRIWVSINGGICSFSMNNFKLENGDNFPEISWTSDHYKQVLSEYSQTRIDNKTITKGDYVVYRRNSHKSLITNGKYKVTGVREIQHKSYGGTTWTELEIQVEGSTRYYKQYSFRKCSVQESRVHEFRTSQIKSQIFCKGCINKYHTKNKGENHKSWKGVGELSSDLYTTIKINARDRNLDFDLEIEYLWDIFLKQNRKCALSGLDIHLNEKCGDKKFKTATLDRINSNIGYLNGNVQWVHRDINKMKSNFPENYLIKLCELIYKKNKNNNFDIEPGAFYKNGIYSKP